MKMQFKYSRISILFKGIHIAAASRYSFVSLMCISKEYSNIRYILFSEGKKRLIFFLGGTIYFLWENMFCK